MKLKLIPDRKIQCKYGYSEPSQTKTIPKPSNKVLNSGYTLNITLDANKVKDLQDLCKSGLIPEEHHHFYTYLILK